MDKKQLKRLLILNVPYFIVGLLTTNIGEAWRLAEGADFSAKLLGFFATFAPAFSNPIPSFHPADLLVGAACGGIMWLAVYLKGKNAKKYRHNVEYGSARWGTPKDIEPFADPKFENNVILTRTEHLMMSNRPKNPANARNKNVLIIGGSGSGKTRFWLKPNLLQMHSSYVVTDPKGSIVILNVKLTNRGLNYAIGNSGLTEDQMERYRLLLQTKGNRPDLFEGNIYATTGEYTDYDIPGEALTDVRFARMIREAEKYLGYPYVWGGSNPSTSFDCSGFVFWVINNCGNGWSVGRLTASGLMNICDIIPRSSAEPGDLIFFQGTYDTTGASHVGIYVGNGMMIHCGNPISYASIETNYWQSHFYCFGRLP